jgi:hypothetical protein
MSGEQDFYTVKQHDSLWKIARDHQTTVADLQKLNGINDPGQIHPGQKIALNKEVVGGFRVLILDKERNPIIGLNYRLEACGKKYSGVTSKSGETKRIVTDGPFDLVHIWLQRVDQSWKKVATVISGFGNKLTVLVSGHLAIPTKTEKHPDLPAGSRPDQKGRPKPAHDSSNLPRQNSKRVNSGVESKNTKTPDGKPVAVAEGDLSELTFLKNYTGERLSDKDWKSVADDLECEVNAIRAIAKVESRGAGFDSTTKRPIILFERHIFHRKSNGKFSDKNPDISARDPYLRVRDKHGKVIPERKTQYEEADRLGKFAESDFYPAAQHVNYKRLTKAVQFEREAGLQSCSWGMFQVMGFNFAACGYKDVESFVSAMATSEVDQIRALRNFIKADKRLIKAIREKDWLSFAIGYNGQKQEGYDKKMANEYNQLTKTK